MVSVVIAFLNGGEWLAQAIESVIKQTFHDWELILVDDGSQEDSTIIAKGYSKAYPQQIKYAEHPGHINRGVTASRNLGIALSKGTFIAFLDADDYWMPEKLAVQMNIFKKFPAAQMICEASLFWYSWNNPAEQDFVVEIGVPKDKLYAPPGLFKTLYPFGSGQPPCPSGIIVRRAALERSGAFEELFAGIYTLYEDQAFLAKMYLSENVYISGFANNRYRKREGSMSDAANYKDIYKKVRLFFIEWLKSYVALKEITDPAILNLIEEKRKKLSHEFWFGMML